MKPKLLFIHTLPALVDAFDRLAAERLPSVERSHILDQPLLERVRRRGGLAPEDTDRVQRHVDMAAEMGASAVLLTCSTLSPCVDELQPPAGVPVLKIDESMIAEAVARGERIAILATNRGTFKPTREAVQAEASRVNRGIKVNEILVDDAFAAYLSADFQTHDELVGRAAVAALPSSDVVILAQASMARALDSVPLEHRKNVLTSPGTAIGRLKELLLV